MHRRHDRQCYSSSSKLNTIKLTQYYNRSGPDRCELLLPCFFSHPTNESMASWGFGRVYDHSSDVESHIVDVIIDKNGACTCDAGSVCLREFLHGRRHMGLVVE